ncbi:MAG: hypothetical protein WKF92_12260 [Pyrinomonadaceae bacterium]
MRPNFSRLSVLIVLTHFAFTAAASAQREGGGAIASIDEAVGSNLGGGTTASTTKTAAKKKIVPKRKTVRTASGTSVASVKKWNGFVVGDKYSFLNFEVASAEKPYHTREAKAGGASGLVQVEVLIDQLGNVLTAKARTGNKLLHPEAERAAIESKFNKPEVYGKPARAIGFLVYRFGPAED